ncbi:hypothetical protein LCGC14_1126320 [marine sediment metagenome]|uniref:Uncharacterized protein n=1 Tax=marine sediment metagenome TaxID=412755 RepID=A0A0F9Q8A0_9ZZZZ
MAVTYGTATENGKEESYAEFDKLVWRGDSYVIRITALYPYKDYANGGDDLSAHIDFLNVTQGISGRFDNIIIPGRDQNEPEGHLRRFSAIRKLKDLVDNATPIASPVFP